MEEKLNHLRVCLHIKMKIVDNTFIARERKTIKYNNKKDVFLWNSLELTVSIPESKVKVLEQTSILSSKIN